MEHTWVKDWCAEITGSTSSPAMPTAPTNSRQIADKTGIPKTLFTATWTPPHQSGPPSRAG